MDVVFGIILAVAAAATGGLIGWLAAARGAAGLRAERDGLADQFKRAMVDLAEAVTQRDELRTTIAAEVARRDAQEAGMQAQIAQLNAAQAALTVQFREVGQAMLDAAQTAFLERAEARFKQSEASAGQNIKALLTPVHDRLEKYETAVAKVEAERQAAYGNLTGLIESMRQGQAEVKAVTANLNNALRNAPKARGRWGEAQLRNVLEQCGLAEYVDFATEVSVATDDGRLRPDVIINVPGGQQLVVDAKVSMNAYQDSAAASDDDQRRAHLAAHARAMKDHVTALGSKNYQAQFDAAPDYVIMFVPGEHLVSAALEHDPDLWNYAFDKRVLIATPTNLVAIARTIAGVWRQENVAKQAKEIAALGKELYARMAVMGGHLARVGKNLDQATGAYNAFVGSFEGQVLTQARRFERLDIDTGGKTLAEVPIAELTARPLSKLAGNAESATAASDGRSDQPR